VLERAERGELAALGARELEALFRDLEVQRRLVTAAQARVLAEVDRRGCHLADGHRDVRAWARATGGWSVRESHDAVAVARMHRDGGAVVAEAVDSARLPVAATVELARVHRRGRCRHVWDRDIELVTAHAAHLDHSDLVHVLRRWEHHASGDDGHGAHDRLHTDRWIALSPVGDSVVLAGAVGTTQGAEMIEVLDRFRALEHQADRAAAAASGDSGPAERTLPRTSRQRTADALHRIFLTANAAMAAERPGGRWSEPLLHLHVDLGTFERRLAAALHVDVPAIPADARPVDPRHVGCRTVTGIPIDPDHAVWAAAAGRVRRIVHDRAGVVLDAGRTRRLFTGALRDVVLAGSTRCTWPGCEVPTTACQADHRHGHASGGPTAAANGDPMCGPHNRHKHRTGATHRRDEHGYDHVHRADGSPVGRTSPRPPERDPP